MLVDIARRDRPELLFAEQCAQVGHVVAERVGQPDAIGVRIDTQTGCRRTCRRALHGSGNRFVAGEYVTLQVSLQVRESAHAASAVSAMARARSNSASRTGRSGMLSTRSIMVETAPTRATAVA